MSRRRRTTLARLPLAAALAIATLLTADRVAFGLHATWAAIAERDPFGVGTPQLVLHDLRREPRRARRALVVGPSRVFEGFSTRLASQQLPELRIAKVANPRFDPFVVRAMVPQLLDTSPDAVVFVWSELDTNRPLRLEPVPGSSIASLGAVRDLVRHTGWRFAIENRTTLYRLVASSALASYRYRAAVLQAGLDDRRRFQLDRRLRPRRALPRIFGEIVYWDAQPREPSDTERRRIVASFGPEADPRFVDLSIDFVAEITGGRHADLQRSFIEGACRLLRERGVEVLVVEGPLHPLAAGLYDTELRREFLAFMARLERELGVRFTPLEAMPTFEAGDFKDLLHTAGRGSFKLSAAIGNALRAALPAGA